MDMSDAPTGLMKRATVRDLVTHRNRALQLYDKAFDALTAANEALLAAHKAAAQASPGRSSYNHHTHEEKAKFLRLLEIPAREGFLATARRITDTDVWAHIVQVTELERIMDHRAKDELRQQIVTDPAEITEDNVVATLERFMLESGTIFRRGIAEAFSKLDRRFRSHDGWKIGSRIILDHMFNEYGTWNYYRNQRDTLQDVERTFFVIAGEAPPPNYAGIVGALEALRMSGSGCRQGEVESDFFKVRVFKNGNCHVWFKRGDLVARVNQLLGEYYGAPIPEEREADEDDGLHNVKTTPAKRYGFFPTPDAAVDHVMHDVSLLRGADQPRLRVLEPSAGTGNLARRCARPSRAQVARHYQDQYRYDPEVDCVEIQRPLAEALLAEGIYGRVYACDFLALAPETTGLYDVVVMNPPFDRERDVDHVMHALKFLKPGGQLTAVMSAGTEFRETKKATAFRALMEKMGARWSDLPAGSFSTVGTNTNTVIVRLRSA